jgi:hypothetical protein
VSITSLPLATEVTRGGKIRAATFVAQPAPQDRRAIPTGGRHQNRHVLMIFQELGFDCPSVAATDQPRHRAVARARDDKARRLCRGFTALRFIPARDWPLTERGYNCKRDEHHQERK